MLTDVRSVALGAAGLTWLGCLGAYLASASQGYIPWCVPHLVGCESVSATGRHGWGYFLFKACLLPASGLLWVYWLLCWHWLGELGARGRLRRSILLCGWTATLALVLYVTFLGSDGDVYRNLRRYGTVIYFGGTYLAQLLLIKQLRDLAYDPALVGLLRWLALAMLFGAASFGLLANFFDNDDALQNISEWNFGSLLTAFPALTWIAWRRNGFSGQALCTSTAVPRPDPL
ncbi:MAG: hypothetical protein AAGG11_19890 [Pseudomonadota bacterium]